MKIVPDSVHSGLDQLRLDGLTNFLGWGPAHIARIPGELASLWGSGLCFLKSTLLMHNDALQSVAWRVDSGLYVWQHGHAEG